jgi:homoserine kinase
MRAEATAPCTVGNFGPGFDVLSLALARPGDRVTLHRAHQDSVEVRGPGADRIPAGWGRNAACAALDHLRKATGEAARLEVRIEKGMPPGSGLGSSASSSAAAVKAFARLHGLTLAPGLALEAAGKGEAVATGGAHYDDVAAALWGGLTIVGGKGPDAVVRLRPPPLHLVVARPEVELPTREMRRLIPLDVPRYDVVHNLSQVARIVHACHAQDAPLLCRALEDALSRPYRAPRVPLFEEARKAAGSAGFILCGSGPAMAAVLPGDEDPKPVEEALRRVFQDGGVPCEVFVTQPAPGVDDPEVPMP